jgi:hypothetical protein
MNSPSYYNQGEQSFNQPTNLFQRTEPKLNTVHGSQVPDIGLDLIMNKHSKQQSPKNLQFNNDSNISSRSSDQNSNLFGDDESDVSDSVSINQGIPSQYNKGFKQFQTNPNKYPNSDDESDESDLSKSPGPQMNYNNQPRFFNQEPQKPYVSEEEIINQKKELLYQFDRLEKRGLRIPKRYSINSDLDEMKADYEKLKREKETDSSVAFQRKMLMAAVSGTEFLNTKFDPFGIVLSGWSETVHDDIQNYDEIFEELHDKYGGASKMGPEVRLIMSLGGSAFMFHLTNKLMGNANVPDLMNVLKKNPDLMRNFANATMNSMNEQQTQQSQQQQQQSQQRNRGFNHDIPQQQQQRQNMKGPTNIDSILRDIETEDLDEKFDEMSMIDSDISDDSSINDLLTKKKNKKNNKRSLNI